MTHDSSVHLRLPQDMRDGLERLSRERAVMAGYPVASLSSYIRWVLETHLAAASARRSGTDRRR